MARTLPLREGGLGLHEVVRVHARGEAVARVEDPNVKLCSDGVKLLNDDVLGCWPC